MLPIDMILLKFTVFICAASEGSDLGSVGTLSENMQAFDEESEVTEQQSLKAPWRNTVAVVIGSGLLIAAMVVMSTSLRPPTDVKKDYDYLVNLAEQECSQPHENCMESHCCSNPEHKCFMKNQYWANCNATCNTGYQDWWDRNQKPPVTDGWNCTELNHPEKKLPCSKDSEDCSGNTECCGEQMICFIKADGWSNCNPTCNYTNNIYDKGQNWTCEHHELKCDPALSENATECDKKECCEKKYPGVTGACTFYTDACQATKPA